MTFFDYVLIGFGILLGLPVVKWVMDKLIEIVCVALMFSTYFVVMSISWIWHNGRSFLQRLCR